MFSLRKLVHMGGVLFVPLAMFSQYLALSMAVLGIGAFFILELLKRKLDPKLAELLYRKGEMSGTAMEPLAYLLSITLLLAISLLYLPQACYVAIIVLTLGDGVATIAGKALGGPKLPRTKKTWSGMLSGVIVSAVAGFPLAGPAALPGAVGGMIAEAYAGKGDNCLTAIVAFLCVAAATLAGF